VQLASRQEEWFIKYIKNPSEEVQLAAIGEDAFAIQWIENPSEKVQLATRWKGHRLH